MNILLTGASSGIGAQAAKLLAPGNTLYLGYGHKQKEAEAVAAAVSQNGGTPYLIKADLGSEAGCKQLVEAVKQHTSSLDCLINCAGGLVKRSHTEDFSWGDMERVFAVNAFSVFMITSLCIPLLKMAKAPSIVNVTSAAIHSGSTGAPLYACAKGAIDVFTRGLSLELAPEIRVNSIAPGVVETPFHAGITTAETLKDWAQSNPSLRNGTPEEIAHAIKFCMENTFLNGACINVNGGKWGL